MCLEPESHEKFFMATRALSYKTLQDLDSYYQENSCSSIDWQLHHMVKIAMKEREEQIKTLREYFIRKI